MAFYLDKLGPAITLLVPQNAMSILAGGAVITLWIHLSHPYSNMIPGLYPKYIYDLSRFDWTMLLFVIKMSKWIKKLKITKILPRLAKIWTNQFQQKTFHIIDAACENEFLIGQTFGKLRLNLSRNHFLSQ